jgi:hypothetical protein
MAGRFLGYRAVHSERSSGAAWVEVTDLANGKVVRFADEAPARPGGNGVVRQVVVTNAGSVGWSTSLPPAPYVPSEFDIYKSDSTGLQRLDSGADLDPLSLLLVGQNLTWRKGGEIFSARLSS